MGGRLLFHNFNFTASECQVHSAVNMNLIRFHLMMRLFMTRQFFSLSINLNQRNKKRLTHINTRLTYWHMRKSAELLRTQLYQS